MLGIANIFRICGVFYIIFGGGLAISALVFTESWFEENATSEMIRMGKQMAIIISSLGIGTGILFLSSSFIKDVNSAKMVLIGVSVSSLLLFLSFLINEIVFSGSPPIPIWIMMAVAFVLSIYGRLKINTIW